MSGRKIVVQLEYNLDVDALLKNIDKLMNNTRKPDLVYVKMSSTWFPNRVFDLPKELQVTFTANPSLKILWDCELDFLDEDEYEVLDLGDRKRIGNDYIEKNTDSCKHEYLDMTMVSVFYDAGINELRKVATRKAVSHWMDQYHLPDEMMFVELGFNGVFTFSQEDFPKQIQYIRIDGNDSHKYLWQKEIIWNMYAKKAKNEKVMFIDSDVSPIGNCDWFYQIYSTLDECLFTQGFRMITYLKQNDTPSRTKKFSYTTTWINDNEIHPRNGVPAGVYCTTKHFLELIGYFNIFSCGYADVLLWDEIVDMTYEHLWGNLFKRKNIKSIVQEMVEYTGKLVVKEVFVDIFHFYHGEFINRSYEQRNFMWMTQYPWIGRIVVIDTNGLLSWVDTNHYFFHVMSQFHTINDDVRRANNLMKEHVYYAQFVKEINMKIRQKIDINMFDLVRMIKKYTIS